MIQRLSPRYIHIGEQESRAMEEDHDGNYVKVDDVVNWLKTQYQLTGEEMAKDFMSEVGEL